MFPGRGRKHHQEFIPFGTKMSLICGVPLKESRGCKSRVGKTGIGFNAAVQKLEDNELYHQVTHEDVQKFGSIPELVGRLPIVPPLMSSMSALSSDVKEPKTPSSSNIRKIMNGRRQAGV